MSESRVANSYWRLAFELPETQQELLEEQLWALGTLGISAQMPSHGRVSLESYFLQEPLDPLPHPIAGWLRERSLQTVEDWLQSYRLSAAPIQVTRSLVVDPGEPDGEAVRRVVQQVDDAEPPLAGGSERSGRSAPADYFLRLPARTAFGTGSHESTRLVAEWMETVELDGRSVLDVGSGSGILSFYALQRGAGRVIGFDLDLESVLVSSEYRRLNRLRPGLFAGRLGALGEQARFDLLLVNILPHRILPELGQLALRLADGGRAVFSGISEPVAEETLATLQAAGWQQLGERRDGEWCAWLMARTEADC